MGRTSPARQVLACTQGVVNPRLVRAPAIAATLPLALAILVGCPSCKDDAATSSSGTGPRPPASAVPLPTGHLQIEEAPPAGDVETLVKDANAKAAAMHRRLLVYEGATWCEPCKRFHKAAAQGDLDAAFPDLNILAFDADRDGERLASAGYVSRLIPLFALPAADGTASGKQVEGGIKGDGAVAYITPRLKGLLEM
jgi:hypothetical protein